MLDMTCCKMNPDLMLKCCCVPHSPCSQHAAARLVGLALAYGCRSGTSDKISSPRIPFQSIERQCHVGVYGISVLSYSAVPCIVSIWHQCRYMVLTGVYRACKGSVSSGNRMLSTSK